MKDTQNVGVQEWADGILKETLTKWEELRRKSKAVDKYGFQVFYSPVRINPDLMIIGYNPGGGESAFHPERDSSIHSITEHEYFENDYPLARKMKDLFKAIGKTKLLKNSVKLNLIFFRTLNVTQLSSFDKGLKREIEAFCFQKVRETIDTLKPKVIITEGIGTFNALLTQALGTSGTIMGYEKAPGTDRRAIFASGSYNQIPVFGLMHLSGARPTREIVEQIERQLGSALKGKE